VKNFDVNTFDVELYDNVLDRGLSSGLGNRDGRMCIEAAICTVLGLEHGDDPGCVAPSVRAFKIKLNDAVWSSPAARAKGLRDLGLAQLGSLGIVSDKEFAKGIALATVNSLLPKVFRAVLPGLEEHAKACELAGDLTAADAAARYAADAAACYAADAAACYAADATACYAAAAAAAAARYAARYAAAAADADDADAAARYAAADEYLILSANLALGVLLTLKSPGCTLLAA